MKNLTLINNEWFYRKNPNVTEEERDILNNKESSNAELRNSTMQAIKSRSLEVASVEDSAKAQALYDANKLVDAKLIAVDISLPSGHGIINCRVVGEHKQIRF